MTKQEQDNILFGIIFGRPPKLEEDDLTRASVARWTVQGFHVGLKRWETRGFCTKKDAEQWALDHCSQWKLSRRPKKI